MEYKAEMCIPTAIFNHISETITLPKDQQDNLLIRSSTVTCLDMKNKVCVTMV